jgi:hypothetical protein
MCLACDLRLPEMDTRSLSTSYSENFTYFNTVCDEWPGRNGLLSQSMVHAEKSCDSKSGFLNTLCLGVSVVKIFDD